MLLPVSDCGFFHLESERSLACNDHNATLQCGSGQVIEIDDSFYGRKTIHYCRSELTTSPASSQEECSWIDVTESITGDISHFWFVFNYCWISKPSKESKNDHTKARFGSAVDYYRKIKKKKSAVMVYM